MMSKIVRRAVFLSAVLLAGLHAQLSVGQTPAAQIPADILSQIRDGKVYAVASAIGESMSVVSFRKQTGRLIDSNLKETFDFGEQGLDNVIMQALEKTLKVHCNNCSTVFLKVNSDRANESADKLLPSLLGGAKNAKADRLIVLTKHRDNARMPFEQAFLGQGKISGLGYYVDPTKQVQDLASLKIVKGYIGAFAYFSMYVIDVATGDVIYSKDFNSAAVFTTARKESFDAWDSVPDDQKIPTLLALVKSSTAEQLNPKTLGLTAP